MAVKSPHLLDQNIIDKRNDRCDSKASHLERRVDRKSGPHDRDMKRMRLFFGRCHRLVDMLIQRRFGHYDERHSQINGVSMICIMVLWRARGYSGVGMR